MPKTKISEFSATPANNTDIDSINIAEGCAPSGINDAIRELMSQLKDFQTGAVGDSFNGPVGTTTAAAGAFTTLSASSTATLSGLTASTALALDASKNIVSVTNTGSGSNVLSTSPTLVTPALGTPSALVGTNITGTASGLTAGNVTTNANLTGAVTSVGNATSLGSFTSSQLAAALTDETGTGSAVFATSPTLVTPILGTPTSATLTNATGLPISTGVSGLGTGVATFLGTPSSANLLAAVSDETGTGSLVFATSPTLVTPILGTPTSGVATNLTGLPLTTGVTGTLPTANGGTNLTSFTSGGVVYASSASALATGGNLLYDGTNLSVKGTNTALRVFDTPNGNYAVFGTISGNTVVGATGGYSIRFDITGTEGMRLTSTGLGIGTSSPSQKLTVLVADGAQALSLQGATGRVRVRPYVDATNGAILESTNTAESAYLPLSLQGTSVRLLTNAGISVTIDTAGGVKTLNTVSVGNATPSTSGAGITFPATQSASSNANTLDDYEEGTFSVYLTDGTNNTTTSSANYTKTGRVVTIQLQIYNVTYTGLTAGSTIRISGLPFAPSGACNAPISFPNSSYPTLMTQNPGGTDLFLYTTNGANNTDWQAVTRTLLGGSTISMYASLTYFV